MAVIRFGRRDRAAPKRCSDEELLGRFAADPEGAWDLFLDRYSGLILSTLYHLGFDHDEAMDRFVYVCEKLCEEDFRRLRSIRFTGREGELTPWLRTVVKRLSVSWAWSVNGRRRLFKSIAELPELEQRVFQLYFWRGLTPSEIHEQLRLEEPAGVRPIEVFDALEVIFSHLSENQRWRLMGQLLRNREPIPIASRQGEDGVGFEPRAGEADPEQVALLSERRQGVASALAELGPRERLILQLRYEEALSLAEVAKVMSLSLSAVKSSVGRSLGRLRQALGEAVGRETGDGGEDRCPA